MFLCPEWGWKYSLLPHTTTEIKVATFNRNDSFLTEFLTTEAHGVFKLTSWTFDMQRVEDGKTNKSKKMVEYSGLLFCLHRSSSLVPFIKYVYIYVL